MVVSAPGLPLRRTCRLRMGSGLLRSREASGGRGSPFLGKALESAGLQDQSSRPGPELSLRSRTCRSLSGSIAPYFSSLHTPGLRARSIRWAIIVFVSLVVAMRAMGPAVVDGDAAGRRVLLNPPPLFKVASPPMIRIRRQRPSDLGIKHRTCRLYVCSTPAARPSGFRPAIERVLLA